ncbi:B-cell receptor CD22-like [Mugil cephalus]|uniref:B-cell receptor CD22-like n=1 Tax=Mugil cephalus TaxID=48193 RepID=UPI001FB8342B|nr:B-cell receptor CD22-like [Mugil cephalus]
MGLTAATRGFFVFLLSVSVVLGQTGYRVTYSSTQICAVKGSTVEINSSFTYPYKVGNRSTTVEKTFWFTGSEIRGSERDDLSTDSKFSGRVTHSCSQKKCTLRISDLREIDSAEYKFIFITNQEGGRFTGSPGVTLTVSVHCVEVKTYSGSSWAEVKCQSSSRLSALSYVWYKNGVNMNKDTYSVQQYFDDGDSVSCAVKGSEKFPSPPQCVLHHTCYKVTYTDRSICAIKGSSVDISSTYSYYYDYVDSKFWFSRDRSRQSMNPSQPEDLSKDSQYSGRVQVLEPETGRSTLRITNLTESDSSEYHFKFKTPWFEWRSVLPGTTLTVTALQVQVTRIISVHQSQTEAELQCLSSCSPAGRLYVWFKNQQRIRTQQTSTLTNNFSPGDTVSCAFSGHEDYRSPSVYAPKLPSVSVSPSGEIVEGSSVTLTCSSDANPAANYTWYKNQTLVSNGPQLVLSSVQPSDSGEYQCTAENTMGKMSSTYIIIDVKYPPKLPSVSVSPSGEIVEGSSVTLTCSSDANPAANYTWYKESSGGPENDNPAATTQRISAEQQDEVCYATVSVSKNQEDPLYSSITLAQYNKQKKKTEKEGDDVVYTAIQFTASGIGREAEEDVSVLYSTVKSKRRK